MLWLYLSLLAAALWASVNIIDKVVLSKYVSNPLFVAIITGFTSLLFALIASAYVKLDFTINSITLFSALLGIISMAVFILYCKSIQFDDVSRVSSLFELTPLFILFLAALFLNEIFTLNVYFGIFLIICGSFLVSIKKFGIKMEYTKALPLMLLACMLLSAQYVAGKYLLSLTDYWSYFFWFNMGIFISSLPLLYFTKKDFVPSIKRLNKKLLFLLLADSISVLGTLLVIVAFSTNPVSLVYTVTSVQPLFVLFYALILSRYFPKVLEEDMSRRAILMKMIAIFMIVAGIYFIS